MRLPKESYTTRLVDSMMQGLITTKEHRGYKRRKNGLLEDCVGQLHTITIDQYVETIGQGEETIEILTVKLKTMPVDLANSNIIG